MDINQTNLQNLIAYIELNNFGVIWSKMKLRKNYHFFENRIKKPENSYFEFTAHSGKWSEISSIHPYLDRDGSKYEEVLVDLELKGTINEYNNKGFTFFTEPIAIQLTIRAYVDQDGWVNSENVHLLNSEQKALTELHKKYETELKRINVKTIYETKYQNEDAFSFFTRIWKNVDNKNPIMVSDTSLSYFNEIGEVYRNIMYSVSCANIWGRYNSHFNDSSFNMDSNKVYQYDPSFYDNRHIFYFISVRTN